MATGIEGDAQAAGKRVVKRYANRKLYDTRASRYVTLQQIADLIRRGEDVQIIDNESKEDLTVVTLAQIIYEEQKQGDTRAWSVGTLRHLIQKGGERLITSLKDGPVGKLVEQAEEDRRAMLEQSREALEELSRMADDRVRTWVAAATKHIHHLQAEVRRLRAQIEELEARLVASKRHRKQKKKQ